MNYFNFISRNNAAFIALFNALAGILLLGYGCEETLFDKTVYDAVQLTAVDISPTDAVLHLNVASDLQFDTLKLLMDEKQIRMWHGSDHDTLLFINQLHPNHRYFFKAVVVQQDGTFLTSKPLNVTTMDTTSHSFAWCIDTLGVGSSHLTDAAIINDSLAYAVGEMYLLDSSGQLETEMYNGARWDGTSWTLFRIPVALYGGSSPWTLPLLTICAFTDSDIWTFSDAGSYSHWNGRQWETQFLTERSGGGTKLWGTSSRDLYLVGTNGSISYYNGQSWQKMESGTTMHLTDIWGSPDGSIVWACGFSAFTSSYGSVLLACSSKVAWNVIWNMTTPTPPYVYSNYLSSLWTSGRGDYLIAGGDVYRQSLIDPTIVRRENVPLRNFAYRVRGSARNNIAMAGDYAMIWHFNGQSWHKYGELMNTSDRLYGLAVSNRLIIAVGTRYSYILRSALVIMGRR